MSETTLHILNRGPNQAQLLQHLLDALSPGDAVVLIEDGVYWASKSLIERFGDQRPYVMGIDALARGVKLDQVNLIDDADFVDLCVTHRRSVSWC